MLRSQVAEALLALGHDALPCVIRWVSIVSESIAMHAQLAPAGAPCAQHSWFTDLV